MSVFRFKKFDVVNERSAMKVNTDGVLLGAVMSIAPEDRTFLDIGTGTGTIALMAAQRLENILCSSSEEVAAVSHIDALDVDEPSASEAAINFAASPWRSILAAYHASLDSFADSENCKFYDLIFSNPPYFESSLQAPEERRNAARHTITGLSYREIVDFAVKRLAENGRLALVLPVETEKDLARYAGMNGLYMFSMTYVQTVPHRAPKRIIAEFCRHRPEDIKKTVLTIQDAGLYTQEYLSLMKDFYLFA